jgi:hypothetical protein
MSVNTRSDAFRKVNVDVYDEVGISYTLPTAGT